MKTMKTYRGVVGSRSRLTIPFDCWMDARITKGLKYWDPDGALFTYNPGVCLTRNMSYRITLTKSHLAPGTEVTMVPVPDEHCIDLRVE